MSTVNNSQLYLWQPSPLSSVVPCITAQRLWTVMHGENYSSLNKHNFYNNNKTDM